MTKAKKQTGSVTAAPAVAPQAATTSPAAPNGKIGAMVALLKGPDGATLAQLVEVTGWQQHSVRGAIAGRPKKKHRLTGTRI